MNSYMDFRVRERRSGEMKSRAALMQELMLMT